MKDVRNDDLRPAKDGVYDHVMDAARYPTMCISMMANEGIETNRIGYVAPDGAGLFAQDLSKSKVLPHVNLGMNAVAAPSRNPFGRRL